MDREIIENVSGVLIAGGQSRRMGHDKRFLKLGGESVFERTLSILRKTFVETLVVLAEPIDSLDVQGSRVVYDIIPNCGSLGGLYTGLILASQPRIFAVACDMPFLSADVIRFMVSFDERADVVVAELSGRSHPMHAVYSRRCAPLLKAMAEEQDLKIQKILRREDLRIAVLAPQDLTFLESGMRSFQNINTPEDLALAEGSVPENS